MVDAAKVQSFADRVLALKAQEDEIKKEIREVYAEAVEDEIDKTGLGQLVTHLRKRGKAPEDFDAKEAIFLGYLELYNVAFARTHAYARARTGEIIEGNEPASSEAQVRSERSGEGGEDAPALSADTQSQPGRSEAPRQIEAGLVAKVEDQSTAARKDVPGSLPVIENGPVLSDNGGRYPVNGEAKVLAASSEVPGTPAGIKPRPSILTIAFLAPLFDYDPETGFVSWKIDFGTAKAGDRAGHVRPSGYRMIQIDGRRYQEHRIAWVLTHGDLPADGRQIDHANQVKDDNRLANLRAATRAEQQINSPTQSNNLHGRGVGWRADRGVWRADIYVNNARVFLGHFEHREDAQAAYEDAAREYYGEFAPQAPPVDTPKKLIKLAPDRADEIGELLDQREAAQ